MMPLSKRSPSSWAVRFPILALAAAGLCIACYLAAYQLERVPEVWEPIFGHGSRTVLHSFVSRLLPVPDAALGAFGYAAEIITGRDRRPGTLLRIAGHRHHLRNHRRVSGAGGPCSYLPPRIRHSRRLHALPDFGRNLSRHCVAGTGGDSRQSCRCKTTALPYSS
jgi:hypothetical protein